MPTRKLQFTFFPFIYVVFVTLALAFALSAHATAVTTAQDVTLRVSGSTVRTATMLSGSTYDTLTIQDSGFQFTLSGTESVTLRSSGKDIMTNTFAVAVTCADTYSELVLPASKGSIVAVGLQGFACSGGGGGGGSSSSSSSSSSSTGGSATAATASTQTVATQATAAPVAPSAPAAPAAVTPSTPATPSSAPSSMLLSRTLKSGSKGEDVMALQRFLQANGYIPSTIKLTGYYGPATTKAVKLFQAKRKLPQVGQVGPMTLKALNAGMSGVPSGSSAPAPSPAPASPATGTTAADIQKQITDLTAMINSLNAQIKARQ